jgi:magnesium-protoporphyrin IX monomethyl ester (oxidative) cyclase
MSVDLLLCCAPVMAVVRPSPALGLLQATFHDRGVDVTSLYLNLLFAERIGVDLNEALAEDIPTHLLTGDWLFAPLLGALPQREQSARHAAELEQTLARKGLEALYHVRDHVVRPFRDEAVERILALSPRIVGFTTMFEQTAASLAIAAEIKRHSPSTRIVFGGANCHGPMGATLLRNYSQIDYVFTGEAELDFAPFVETLLGRSGAVATPRGYIGRDVPPGLPASPVNDLDRLPIPDYSDYFEQLALLSERDRIRPSIPFESSRGCWWGQKHHCTFCGLNPTGMAYRAKSAERVVDEIEELGVRHGIDRFFATDNILSIGHVDNVMRKLGSQEGEVPTRRLFYEIKANLDEAQLRVLGEAGATWLQPGIESLCDSVLKIMRKGVNTITNLKLLRNSREIGVGIIWSILYGFPGEPPEDYAHLATQLPLFAHLTPPNSCLRIRLDRFSPNYDQAEAIGFRHVRPMPAYGALFDLPEDDLADVAYFFEGDAPSSASDEDLNALKAAVAVWRSHWEQGKVTPQLTMATAAHGKLVKDTRSCAVDPLHFVSGAELAVIDILRTPMSRVKLFEQMIDHHGPDETELALAEMLRRGFVVDAWGVLMTLVTEAGLEIFDAAARADQPHGYLVPVAGLPGSPPSAVHRPQHNASVARASVAA